MPLKQLIRKLGKRDSNNRVAGTREAADMDCDCQPCGIVTAEVVKHDGMRSPCSASMRSSSASSDAVFDNTAGSSAPQTHQHRSINIPAESSSGLTMIGSLPSSTTTVGQPAVSARVLRAKGKAALRTHSTQGIDSMAGEQQDTQQPQSMHPVGSSSSCRLEPVGPRHISTGGCSSYHRSATDPVRLWVQTGSISSQLTSIPAAVAAAAAANEDAGDDDDENEPLASPVSPAGHSHLPQEEDHCEWEDGVVAGWLNDIDPSELMHHGDEEEETAGAGAVGAGSPPERTVSSMSANMSSEVVYSSLLYS